MFNFSRMGARSLNGIFFGRVQFCVALSVWILVILGCMSINLGGVTIPDTSGIVTQEGKIPVRRGTEQLVHYPKPYSTPPNLELTDGANVCDIVEQKETGFRVRFRPDASGVQTVSWKSRGMEPTKAEVTTTTGTGVVPASTK